MAKYKCKVCGYIHEGNKAPDVCPVCAAPASDFEEMKDEAAADKKKGLDRDSNVYTVVYASVMVVLVAVVLAFTSQSLRTFQQKNTLNATKWNGSGKVISSEAPSGTPEDGDMWFEYIH